MNHDELLKNMADPWWRITSGALYKIMIKGDNGETELVIPFIPNAPQLALLENLHNRNLILKARQIGFTTLIAIYFLDCALFRPNVRAGIVAQSEDVAKIIFRDKVYFAYNNLPPALLAAMPLSTDSQSELLLAHNNSSIRVATSMRAGTLQYLHVSEFGKIGAKFPERAKEVVTGSIPAVPDNGVIFIESTAEGQEGEFFTMSKRAESLADAGNKISKKDFKFFFFAWWSEEKYRVNPDGILITQKDHEYFDAIEVKMGCKLDMEQRAWWCNMRDAGFSGAEEKMWQEYPSTPVEAFQKSTEGCYYTVQMVAARKAGRITSVPYKQGHPVNTFWDIGSGDGTAIWFHQRIGQNDNFIKYIEAWGEPYSYFVSEMQKTGYIWGRHYLPHDGNHVRQGMISNTNPKAMLEQLGLRNVEIVPVVEDISHGIQLTRNKLQSCWFDAAECKDGILHLESYKKQWSSTNQRFTDTPKHDEHSEGADAFRQFAQGYTDSVEYGPIKYKNLGHC